MAKSSYTPNDIEAAFARIEEIDPLVNAVSQLACRMGEERIAPSRIDGTIAGMPVLVKDNIEVAGRLPTTAGSLALCNNVTDRSAGVVERLENAGVVVIGKAAMSEWANFRSDHSIPGWSAAAGLTRNPHVLDRVAGSSSSGSAAAVAAGMVPAAIGTETNGSITSPASINGVVGMKPTVGLVSRRGIVPISHTQGTAGPLASCVETAAALLSVMAGCDPLDPATGLADRMRSDLCKPLETGRIAGMRIGVLRFAMPENTDASFEEALEVLVSLGAVLIDVAESPDLALVARLDREVMLVEARASIDGYLARTDPEKVEVRSLEDLVRFNETHAAEELQLFGQDIFLEALQCPSMGDAGYLSARNRSCRMAGVDGIDRMLADHHLQVLVGPTQGPAIKLDLVNRHAHAVEGASLLAAVAGYPHLTVPMRPIQSLPVGISFVGPRWSDALVLSVGLAYERAASLSVKPRFLASLEDDPQARAALGRQQTG